jgi:hypothetical protein
MVGPPFMVMKDTLNSVISNLCNVNSLSDIVEPHETDVLRSNPTSYCHISLPYITGFSITANHTLALHHVSICGVSYSCV